MWRRGWWWWVEEMSYIFKRHSNPSLVLPLLVGNFLGSMVIGEGNEVLLVGVLVSNWWKTHFKERKMAANVVVIENKTGKCIFRLGLEGDSWEEFVGVWVWRERGENIWLEIWASEFWGRGRRFVSEMMKLVRREKMWNLKILRTTQRTNPKDLHYFLLTATMVVF